MAAPAIHITGFDHLVLRCHDVETSLAWYVDRLGLAAERVDAWRAGEVPFPSVRIDATSVIDLMAADGDLGGANVDHFCVVADRDTVESIAAAAGTTFDVLEGPVPRWGARGTGTSVYVRDPDSNVVEIRTYD